MLIKLKRCVVRRGTWHMATVDRAAPNTTRGKTIGRPFATKCLKWVGLLILTRVTNLARLKSVGTFSVNPSTPSEPRAPATLLLITMSFSHLFTLNDETTKSLARVWGDAAAAATQRAVRRDGWQARRVVRQLGGAPVRVVPPGSPAARVRRRSTRNRGALRRPIPLIARTLH